MIDILFEEGGNAVADILYGNVSPSAKLSVSYPSEELNEPICYNQLSNDQLSNSKIQWPFGYGLSYTTFEYKHLLVDKDVSTDDEYVNVSFEVKNTGKVAADEVAQVYISPNDDTPLRPIQLQGFARVSLEPGQSKTIRVRLSTEQFGFYSHEGQRQWNIQPGSYTVKVGASSADIRLQQKVTFKGNAVSKPLRSVYFSKTIISD